MDCDAIYDEKIKNLTDIHDAAIKAAKDKYAAERADAYQDYYNTVSLENASFAGGMAQIDADFLHEIYTEIQQAEAALPRPRNFARLRERTHPQNPTIPFGAPLSF